ncbi:hypothetical protein, partial [Streptomyces sp. PU_AKi4]|uniref:hypothetical protein n=1 Tax=Streptomyces sp. PU_AKi4 TaxID=2800809 RepID=UPI003525ECF4
MHRLVLATPAPAVLLLQDCGRFPWFAAWLRRAFFLRRLFEDMRVSLVTYSRETTSHPVVPGPTNGIGPSSQCSSRRGAPPL